MIIIYTDGGCHGNPGPGGWAYLIIKNGTITSAAGSSPETTNNRMELLAVIRALEASDLTENESVCVRTDSQYVQKGISRWIIQWEKNGWLTATKKPVKNKDLWTELRALSDRLTIKWDWVAGHSTDKLNQVCDTLVQEVIKSST